MDIFEWEETIPVTANNLNEMQNIINNNITSKRAEIGKTLWEGSFTTGTLQIPNLSDYSIIVIYVGGLAMIGNQRYGGTNFRTYRSASISSYAYRFTYNEGNNTISTDTDNPGASDGTNQLTITKIVGVF